MITEEQIIEYLKLCIEFEPKPVLEFINRQKAEINKLTYQVNRLKKYDEERDIRLHARLTATAKAEAIKEFAERLKESLNDVARWSMHGDNKEYFIIGTELIDNLVKELTEPSLLDKKFGGDAE